MLWDDDYMNTRTIVLLGILLLLLGYAGGRYLQPQKEVIKTQTVTVEHTHTVTITVHDKDGSSTTTTTTDTGTTTDTSSKTSITNNKTLWKVGALAGLPVRGPYTPIYGGQVEHSFIGPVSIGVWGLNNSTGGVSLSLQF